MSWIESHQSLARHRKTLAVMAALNINRHKLIGHLHEFWWWGLDNADVQGHVGHVTKEILADAAGWPVKDAGRWVAALLSAGGDHSAGFLESDETGYILHDWEDYAGKYNDQRELRRVSNRESQQRRRQRLRGPEDADVVINGHADKNDAVSTVSKSQHSTGPTGPTGPDQPENPPTPLARGSGRRSRNGVDPEQRMSFPTGVQP